MSPRFYAYLWVGFLAAAGLCWVAGIVTMLVASAFGFVAFGLIFTGMMCVLPGQVHADHVAEQMPKAREATPEVREAQPALVARLRSV